MNTPNRTPLLAAAAAAGLMATLLPAQLARGSTAPPFDFAKTWNDAPGSFAELKGKLVILDFFGTT